MQVTISGALGTGSEGEDEGGDDEGNGSADVEGATTGTPADGRKMHLSHSMFQSTVGGMGLAFK